MGKRNLFTLSRGEDDLMYSHVDIKSNEHWDKNGCFSITQDDKYGYIWIVSTQGLYALQKHK